MARYDDFTNTESDRTHAQNQLISTERKDATNTGIVGSADKSGSSLKDPLFKFGDTSVDMLKKEKAGEDVSDGIVITPNLLKSTVRENDSSEDFGDDAGGFAGEQSKALGFKMILRKRKEKKASADPLHDDKPQNTVTPKSTNNKSSDNKNMGLGKLSEKKYQKARSSESVKKAAQSRRNQHKSHFFSKNTGAAKKKAAAKDMISLNSGLGGKALMFGGSTAMLVFIPCILALIILGALAGDEDMGDAEELTGNEKIVAEYLLGKGLDTLHTAAIMGNIEAESEFNPALIEKATGVGHGLCQWGGDGVRLEGLYAYTKSKGKDWTDIYCQLDYLWAEMTGKGDAKKYAEFQGFSYKHNEFLAITDLEDAVYYFGRKFERPNEKYAHWDRRITKAWHYYNLLGGNGNIITEAKLHLGKPYVWGTQGPNTFDCSGFVYYVYNKCGIKIHRTTAQGLYNMSSKLKKDQAASGDLVFFGSSKSGITHVGIYMGSGKFIHAPSTGDVVKITKVSVMNNTIGYGRIK